MRSCGWIVAAFTACAAAAAPTTEVAKYEVKLLGASPLRFSIRADLPIHGAGLDMFSSYPAELPEMAANGWPALVFNFKAADRSGKPIALESAGAAGWKLAQVYDGRIVLSYDVDFSIFAAKSWPSPLESAYEDATHIVVSARALFVTTGQIGSVEVDLDIPGSWRPVMPWNRRASSGTRYIVRTAEDLTDNMLVFSTVAPDVVKAAGFTMQITEMGHWEPLRPTVRDVLGTVIEREVKLMHYREPETYSIVLLPIEDEGGEAYRQSFVYCFANPSAGNRATWGNTLAHEIFHYWNYARLRGADYASTQWFQEGFTEYVANVTLVSGKITDPDTFMAKLGKHAQNYRKLTTTLEAIGTKKGPPLYSAGALVAFSWDVMIRKVSGGRRNIGNFFRNLWRQTGGGAREYAWPDIRAALEATASADWEAFYQAHIKGHDALPIDDVMATAGLKLGKDVAGLDVVELDPAASVSERTLWLALVGGK